MEALHEHAEVGGMAATLRCGGMCLWALRAGDAVWWRALRYAVLRQGCCAAVGCAAPG